MRHAVVPQAFALGPQHQRHARFADRLAQHRVRIAIQADAPIACLGNLIERARQVHHPHPRHDFQRARRRARQHARFGRRMPVLRDDAQRVERRRRPQDRADIMRVRHLVQHQDRALVVAPLFQHFVQPDIVQRFDFGDDALMRRVRRDHPAHVGDVGIDDRQHRGQVERGQRFARAPYLAHDAIGVGESRDNGVTPIEAREGALGLGGAMTSFHDCAHFTSTH